MIFSPATPAVTLAYEDAPLTMDELEVPRLPIPAFIASCIAFIRFLAAAAAAAIAAPAPPAPPLAEESTAKSARDTKDAAE